MLLLNGRLQALVEFVPDEVEDESDEAEDQGVQQGEPHLVVFVDIGFNVLCPTSECLDDAVGHTSGTLLAHQAVPLLRICLDHIDFREIHRELRDPGQLSLQKLVERVRLLFQVFDQFGKSLGDLDLGDLGPDLFFAHLLVAHLGILGTLHASQVKLIGHYSDHLAYLVEFLRQTVALGAEHAELVFQELHLARLHQDLCAEH